MKKGFTLIEIIISISIVLLVGTTFVVGLHNHNDDPLDVNEDIVGAVQTYLSVEKDINGNSYLDGVFSGGEGIIIPLEDLNTNGYLDDTIYDNIVTNVEKKYRYVVVGFKTSEECVSGTSITIPWEENLVESTTYICGFGGGEGSSNTLYDKIIEQYDEYGTTNCPVTKRSCDDYDIIYEPKLSDKFDATLCKYENNNENDSVFYYKGMADQNYLKIGSNIYRIVRTVKYDDDKTGIKIVSDTDELIDVNISVPRSSTSITMSYIGFDGGDLYGKFPKIDRLSQKTSGGYYFSLYYDSDFNDKTEHCSTGKWNVEKNDCSYLLKNGTSEYTNDFKKYLPYELYYKKLLSKWESTYKRDLDSLVINFNWCVSSHSNATNYPNFECEESVFNAESKFGLLNESEYYTLGTIVLEDPFEAVKIYPSTEVVTNMDVSFQVKAADYPLDMIFTEKMTLAGISCNNELGTSYKKDGYYLKPAFVIPGDILVLDGDGSETNPYVLESA